MAISRAQMEQQIKGFERGGLVTDEELADFTGQLGITTPTGDPMNTEIALLKQLMAMQPDYDEQVTKYQERLTATEMPSEPPSFYQLMSDLGAAIAAAPADTGAFTAAAGGFKQFSERMRATATEQRKYRQQIALEAAKMAMEDERKAEEKIRDFVQEAYLSAAKEPDDPVDTISLQYDEIDENGEFTGKRVQGSFDRTTQRKQIRKILDEQNGIDIEALPDPPGETEGDKAAWKKLIDESTRINDAATKAYGKQDTIFNAKAIASQLGPEGFGRGQEFLVGIRGFLADIAPWSMSDADFAKLSRQEALAALTIDFTMANVAATKGAVSDKEMALFKSAAPFLGQTYDGFMLALQIQEQAAAKQTEFADSYNAEYDKFAMDNPTATGRQAQSHMAKWSREWQRGEQSSFLSEDQKEQIRNFEKDAKDRGIATPYSIDDAERRQRAFTKKRRAEESETQSETTGVPLISPAALARLSPEVQDIINRALNDDSYTEDQKTKLIFDAIRGES